METTFAKTLPARKICLIGGSGFIGTRLAADLWHQGYYVSIADIQPSRHYPDSCRNADVRHLDSLQIACAGNDTIINLAAAHRDDVRPASLYHDINVTGAENVCRAAEQLGINRIIFTSSAAVYGTQDGNIDETRPHQPINEYGVTKSKAEDVYCAWQEKDPQNRTLVIVRPTVVFGTGNRGNVYTLIKQIVKGRFLMIGNGQNRKSMAYVENVAAFLIFSLNFGPGIHIYNYVDKPDLSMNELLGMIRSMTGKPAGRMPRLPQPVGEIAGSAFDLLAKMTGRTFPVSRVRIEKFCATTVFSSDKLRGSGLSPPHNLQQALEKTISAEFPQASQERAAS